MSLKLSKQKIQTLAHLGAHDGNGLSLPVPDSTMAELNESGG